MTLSCNFNKSSDAILKIQEAENKTYENDNSFELYLSEPPELKNLKNYWSPQGAESNDVAYWEREVENMMESVESIHKALSDVPEVNDIFKIHQEEFKNLKTVVSQKDLKASIEEIEKMDAILKMKVTQEREAKLCRIQAEEESKNILTNLPSGKMSNGVKINLKEFLRLLNEGEKPENDSFSFVKPNEPDEVGQDDCEVEKKKVSNYKFVKRNIQLAKSGCGTLSLTDEEKLRIKNLLMDIEDSREAEELKTRDVQKNEKVFCAMDEKAKLILNQIDEKLESFTKEKRSLEGEQNEMILLGKAEREGKPFEGDEKENPSKGKQNSKKKSNRLKEINKLLCSLNEVSYEEISPLTEEEIGSLVRQSLEPEKDCEAEGKEWTKPTEDAIVELVSISRGKQFLVDVEENLFLILPLPPVPQFH